MRSVLIGCLALASCFSPALAAEYGQVQNNLSTLQFSYQQMGVKMEGHFKKFQSQLRFDPSKPAAATVFFEVELGSIELGSGEANQEINGKPWLNIPAFPRASFVTSSIKPSGTSQYEVSGKLSIKGQTRELTFPASFTAQGKQGVFEGRFTLRRSDFGIGEGAWAKTDIVANEVPIHFRLTALRH